MDSNLRDTFSDMWDASRWLRQFQREASERAPRDARRLVFLDTVKRVREGLVEIPPSRDSIFYSQEVHPRPQKDVYETELIVLNNDTLVAAQALLARGLRPAVLNMASGARPGGGVYTGAAAQEESLFRRTDLFRSMYVFASWAEKYGLTRSQHQYPLDLTWGGIYTPQATVFRGPEADGYPLLDHPFQVDFVAVPAVRKPNLDERGMIVPELVEVTKKKIRQIFRIAIENGNDSLLLGAFGCGAYGNPPVHMARLFHEVIDEDEFRTRFKVICFAIIGDQNLTAFMTEFPSAETKP